MNNFYVYLHRRKSDNKVLYVGKGSGNRAYSKDSRNSHWKNTVTKHGYFVEIVFEELTEEEAFSLEKDTILEFTYFGYPLTNKTEGGEGISGYKHTTDSKLKMIDKTVYTFVNKSGEVFIGTRFELTSIKKVDRLNLSQMFSNPKIGSAEGWVVKQTDETFGMCVARAKYKKSLAKSDKNQYTFQNKSGEVFTGTRFELAQKYNLDLNRVCELFSKKKRKSTQGWSLIGEINEQTK